MGDSGAIIHTTNGGRQWIKQNSGVNETLLQLHSHDGKTIIAVGFNGTILRTVNSGQTWDKISTSVTGNMWAVKMLDDTLGWACGTNTSLLKTTDGGINWQSVETGHPGIAYWNMTFITKDTFYVSCSGGVYLKTEDGGNSWISKSVNMSIGLYTIKAFNDKKIVAGGGQGYIAYTEDGGVNWSYSRVDINVNSFAFVNDSLGYALGTEEDSILKTTDGGKTWKYIWLGSLLGLNNINFVNDSVGYITGNPLILQKTTDQGHTWKSTVIRDDFSDIFFISPEKGFAVSPGSLYCTTDKGATWSLKPNSPYGCMNIVFTDSLTGFIGGYENKIYKTTNSGITWTMKNITGKTDSLYFINKIVFPDKKTGYACGVYDTYKTTDSGENWYSVSAKGGYSLFFTDSLTGLVLSRPVIKTTNGGITWTQIKIIDDDCSDIYFRNSEDGYITFFNLLYRTTDGGNCWEPEPKVSDYNSGWLGFLTKEHGFVLGTLQYETTDGGDNWVNISNQIGTNLLKFHSPSCKYGICNWR